MRSKLKINADHYNTKTLRKVYVKIRIDDEASTHIVSRLRKEFKHSFLTAKNIFDCLYKIYDDSNRRHTTQTQFRKLRQSNRDFSSFWTEFQRLISKLNYNDETLIDELQNKISLKMQRLLTIIEKKSIDLYFFARRCQRMNQKFRDVNDRTRVVNRLEVESITSTSSVTTTNSKITVITSITTSTSRTFALRSSHLDAKKEKLMKTKSCFYCKESEHMSKKCSKKTSRAAVLKIEAKTNSNSKKE